MGRLSAPQGGGLCPPPPTLGSFTVTVLCSHGCIRLVLEPSGLSQPSASSDPLTWALHPLSGHGFGKMGSTWPEPFLPLPLPQPHSVTRSGYKRPAPSVKGVRRVDQGKRAPHTGPCKRDDGHLPFLSTCYVPHRQTTLGSCVCSRDPGAVKATRSLRAPPRVALPLPHLVPHLPTRCPQLLSRETVASPSPSLALPLGSPAQDKTLNLLFPLPGTRFPQNLEGPALCGLFAPQLSLPHEAHPELPARGTPSPGIPPVAVVRDSTESTPA